MLAGKEAIATVAVKDLGVARKFYEGALGLKRTADEQQGVAMYVTGGSKLIVYQSQYAGTNQATGVTWVLGPDFDNIIQALKAKGVAFEQYDFPGATRKGDVHLMGDMKAAWFKDPDGNIHGLVSS
jgi:catechol 2,3-dioxygenase-like lactoylglutathione lyase family enzyme